MDDSPSRASQEAGTSHTLALPAPPEWVCSKGEFLSILKMLEHSLPSRQKRQMFLRWRPAGDGYVGQGGMLPHCPEVWPPFMEEAHARAAGT